MKMISGAPGGGGVLYPFCDNTGLDEKPTRVVASNAHVKDNSTCLLRCNWNNAQGDTCQCTDVYVELIVHCGRKLAVGGIE